MKTPWLCGPQMFSYSIYPGLLLTGTTTLLSSLPSMTLMVSSVTGQLDISTCASVLLCHTMACFHMISTSLISGRDHPCAHYFHIP